MIIAVNTRSFSKKNNPESFIELALLQISKNNPAHQFIFFVDESFITETALSKNIVIVKSRSSAKSSFLSALWHNYQLPALLKKHKPALLINTKSVTPASTKIPQWMVIENQSIFDQSKRKLTNVISQAAVIIANSTYLKTLLSGCTTDTEKIKVVYNAPEKIYAPLTWEEKQIVLKQYSNEKEYFFCNASNCNEDKLISLLKAFSIFKKWQKSNMQLIIASDNLSKSFKENYKHYKHKEDVILLEEFSAKDLAAITGSAYGYINPDENTGYSKILAAIQCNIPVVTISNEISEEVFVDAVIYCKPDNIDEMAKNMILLYKDENRRNELIKKGVAISHKHSYAGSLQALNNLIFKESPTLL